MANNHNPVFSINQAAINLFHSHYDDLLILKNKLVENSKSKSPSLIMITGQSVGGSVATLFTLWLLQGLNLSKTKRPLCVTFGSPLVGDEDLRQCVLQFLTWKSCFLHIASNQDPTPSAFLSRNTISAYKPFGTFLLCSASGCACFEDPDIILEQLVKTNSQNAQNQDLNFGCHYGKILGDLKCISLRNAFKSTEGLADSLQASIITQLRAIDVLSQQQPVTEVYSLIGRMKKHETKLLIQKKKNSDSDKKLNEMKVYMAFLEWYKKESKQRNVGYYDMYRNQWNPSDINVNEYKKKLMNYWEDSVTEVENKPQLEGAHFQVRWLYAGDTYRRMVEPLHIADYYRDGRKNYKIGGKRPKHFILLEEWYKQEQEQEEKKKQEKQKQERKAEASPLKSKREKVGSSLNDDSCFWENVEEALILLKNGVLTTEDKEKLKKFEDYVWNVLKNYAVSPEIFLEKSSFMLWWRECKKIVEQPYSSLLMEFMKGRYYEEYKVGRFDPKKCGLCQ
ncbi:hypothetical protein M0R45_033545 [Rubus argutus]|uniref:Carboxylesterase n=1 Tax=Rubus argutus TaxID=59490 RepID=A0AAW1WNM1_RUBAR